ncbi:hypothetical protein BH11PSE12_BH11PSE12_11590 [soil metagenome]
MKEHMDQATSPLHTRPDGHQSNAELQAENRVLRSRLQELLEQAHRNQNIMSRHQTLDLALIGTSSFRELIENIFNTLAKISELDQITLCLLNHQNNLRQILTDLKIDESEFPQLLFADSELELRLDGVPLRKPVLGAYDARLHAAKFAACPGQPGSVAIVPLIRQNKLLGCLNLGSIEPSRFTGSMATDFIERLASIIAICLENVINSERLTHIGLTDALTNVSNRRFVEQRILEEIGRARRQQYSIACMYLDIDFFKKINDVYGHQSGDDVLKEVASRIKAELRLSDTLGRFGGEEFVVILVNAKLQDAVQVAERIRSSIAGKPFKLSMAGACETSISIGVATLGEADNQGDIHTAAHELLWRADQALYEAKEQGRNRVCQSV